MELHTHSPIVLDLLHEIIKPHSRATINERDAAAIVLQAVNAHRDGDPLLIPDYLADLILGYYAREYHDTMGTHLTAWGA